MYSVGQPLPPLDPCYFEAPEPFDPEDPTLREPRALWQVVSIDSSEPDFTRGQNAQAVQAQVTLRGPEWKNGSRYPLVLTHLLLDAVGYTLADQTGAPVDITTYHNCQAILPAVGVRIAAPYRKYFTREEFIGTWGHVPMPAGQPTTRYSTDPTASSPWGITRWDFSEPYWIPRGGTVQFDLSAIGYPNLTYFDDPASVARQPQAFINFEQQYRGGGAFRMSSRMVSGAVPLAVNPAQWPAGGVAVPADAFGYQAAAAGQPFSSELMWPGDLSTLAGNEWDKQEANRGAARSWLTGFGVFLDQILWDESITTAVETLGQRVAPLASNIGTRCKSVNGGTNQWWWRPGCPLSLVSPTMTPALVHRLPDPITLAPGDNLEVQLSVPLPQTIAGASPPTLEPVYNVGVSLCGYAEVQG